MASCLDKYNYKYILINYFFIVASMLEAIIAFMPIQEDHQAIGALNYPIETRKKFALASKDYKCDVCGPVKNIVENNFKKDINDNSKNNNNNLKNDNDSDKKNEKENIVEKVVLLDDKIKSDFNIENSDNKFENENKEFLDNKNKNEEKNNDMDFVKVKDSKIDDNVNLKKNKSENINFSEEFKKLRQSQYENILKKPKSDNIDNKIEKEKEDNKFLKIEKKESKENILNEINEEENINDNLIESEFNDEVDFNLVQNTIKFHGNKSNEEIENELKNNFQNKSLLNQLLFNKNIKEQIPLNKNIVEDDDNINDNEFTKKIKHLTYEKKVLEKFLKKKISFVKYCSRKTYEKERDKEIRNFTIVMGILILLVFFIYFIFHKIF